MPALPDDDDRDDLLVACRFGDLPDVERFVARFSPDALTLVHDDRGNTPLHMAAANGHADVLEYLLPLLPPHALAQPNDAGSTPLHWAALNRHLGIVQTLVRSPRGPGIDMIDIKNHAGRSPLGEAELAGWDEGARWLVQVMNLKLDGDGTVEDDDERSSVDPSQTIEVEIRDADGRIASLSIGPDASNSD